MLLEFSVLTNFGDGGVLDDGECRAPRSRCLTNARAVPKPKVARHHQSKHVDASGARGSSVKNAARQHAILQPQGKTSVSARWRECGGTTSHHQMATRGRTRRRYKRWRDELVQVKGVVVDVVEKAGVEIGAWCTSTTKHHQVATSVKMSVSM